MDNQRTPDDKQLKEQAIQDLAEVLRSGFGEMGWSRYLNMAKKAIDAGYTRLTETQEQKVLMYICNRANACIEASYCRDSKPHKWDADGCNNTCQSIRDSKCVPIKGGLN